MPSNGNGVNVDNAVPSLRITYQDDSHPDAQLDQLGNFRYDHSKVWATMGRVGANGVMRAGMVELGDALGAGAGAWSACSIEGVAAGVAIGVENWNTNLAYNPLGGIAGAGNDFCMFGALAPFDEVLLHLAAGIAAPTYVVEYWTGAAWAAMTTATLPDFTCAGGILNQRLVVVRPSGWTRSTGAQLGIAGLANAGSYYRLRLRLTAPSAAPAANTAYRDFLKGYWRRFDFDRSYKRGDDTANATTAAFRDDGNFSLHFRDTFGLEGRTGVGGSSCDWGSVDTTTERPTIGKAWTVVQTGKQLVLNGGMFAGGLIASIPKHRDDTGTNFIIRGNLLPLDMHGVMLNGFSFGYQFGAAGATAVRRLTNVRMTPHPLVDSTAASRVLMTQFAIDQSAGFTDRIVVDVRRCTNKWTSVVRTSVAGRIDGLHLTSDEVLSGQIEYTGGSTSNAFNIDWGGPTNQLAPSVGFNSVYRKLTFRVREDGSTLPVAGIPIQIYGSDSMLQGEALTDVNGRLDYINPLSGLSVGLQNRQIFLTKRNASATLTVFDEPYIIMVNSAGHAAFNPLYQSLVYRSRFPRAILFNFNTGAYEEVDWQRRDLEMIVALPLVPVAPPPVPCAPAYTPQFPPVTPFVPSDEPGTPYTHTSVPAVDYVECGTPAVSGGVLLLAPGMAMPIPGP